MQDYAGRRSAAVFPEFLLCFTEVPLAELHARGSGQAAHGRSARLGGAQPGLALGFAEDFLFFPMGKSVYRGIYRGYLLYFLGVPQSNSKLELQNFMKEVYTLV